MSPRSDGDDTTKRSVRDRYTAYREANPRQRSRSAITLPVPSDDVLRLVGTAVGVVTGLGLLALALVAFGAARNWGAVDRDGAAVAYGLTAFFLTVAGLGAIVATLNHNFRVAVSEPEHH
jgi:hypothetical protein